MESVKETESRRRIRCRTPGEPDLEGRKDASKTALVVLALLATMAALQMMKVGSKWKLFVPAKLAYGDQGAGELIAPGSTLIFEIELLAIK